ncbi:hypothetical protein HA050_20285 [Iodobacter sp. HSC-16F04]|uniref:Uncharacterized protein n=1 Tax=Iodobacter violaceini TaxID=3044271 RepID=A0ABX0L740_9NEIS|nr:hypothetical protein [Iodobacter violacea]NHQ88443.1 hypothetical protein [Iodobacter violacea]
MTALHSLSNTGPYLSPYTKIQTTLNQTEDGTDHLPNEIACRSLASAAVRITVIILLDMAACFHA